MNRSVVWHLDGMFESVFKFDVGFSISRLNLDFSVTLLMYTVTVNKVTIDQQ
jgi:hypothetical protein